MIYSVGSDIFFLRFITFQIKLNRNKLTKLLSNTTYCVLLKFVFTPK